MVSGCWPVAAAVFNRDKVAVSAVQLHALPLMAPINHGYHTPSGATKGQKEPSSSFFRAGVEPAQISAASGAR